MPRAVAASPILRFGLYELDPERWELRRSGVLIALQEQPCRLLHLLAAHPNETLSREAIRAHIWPEEVSGDFGARTNFCLARIRDALGDDAGNPRFIKTIRGQGYCFMAPELAAAAGVTQAPARTPMWPWLAGAGMLTAAAALMVAWWWWRPGSSPQLHELGVIAVSREPFSEMLVAAPDYLYVTEPNATASTQVFRIPLAGGEPQPVALALNEPAVVAASPDGKMLVLQANAHSMEIESQAWLAPSAGGEVRPFGQVQAPFVAWRPDGGAVVYGKNDEIWLADSAGHNLRRLAQLPGWSVQAMTWARDGSKLYFGATNAEQSTIAIWAASPGGRLQRLTRMPGNSDFHAMAYVPNPRAVIFRSYSLLRNSDLYEALPLPCRAACDVFEIAQGGEDDNGPVVDGQGRILLSAAPQRVGDALRWDVKQRTFEPILNDARDVNYSPDGRRVVFVSAADWSLWLREGGTGRQVKLLAPPFISELPRWSPDGRRIAVSVLAPGQNWRLALLDPDAGAGESALQWLPLPADGAGAGAPTWTPDGKAIYFGGADCAASDRCGIYRLDLASGGITMIPGSAGMRTARLSPDGHTLAALEFSGMDIWMLDVASPGAVWRKAVSGPVADAMEWAHDSRGLYYGVDQTGGLAIRRLAWPSGAQSQVAFLTATAQPPVDDKLVDWLGLAPGDVPLLTNVVLRHSLTALALSSR